MTLKQQFLREHNRLSPPNLRVTADVLSQFRNEKPALFKHTDWSTDKLRRPFIIWLGSYSPKKRK